MAASSLLPTWERKERFALGSYYEIEPCEVHRGRCGARPSSRAGPRWGPEQGRAIG